MARMRLILSLLWLAIFCAKDVAAFTLTPTRLEFDPDERMGVIKLENPGERAGTFTVRTYTWDDSNDPNAISPTNELISVPPLFDVGPNQTQTIRVALRGPLNSEKERAYRILISQMASEVGPGSEVRINYAMNVPVFVRSKEFQAKPVWEIKWDPSNPGRMLLAFANAGTAHIRLRDLRLLAEPRLPPIFNFDPAVVIFAGEDRNWPLDAALAELKGPLSIQAETDDGPIKTVLTLPEH